MEHTLQCMLQRDVTVTSLRHGHKKSAAYFEKVQDLSYYTDIARLTKQLNGFMTLMWRLSFQ